MLTLGPTWCEASAKLRNVVGPGRPRASHGFNLAAIGIDLWARFQPNMTNWLQIARLGPMLGPSWPKLRPFGAARGNTGQFPDSMRGHVAHTGPGLDPKLASKRAMLRCVGPKLEPTWA